MLTIRDFPFRGSNPLYSDIYTILIRADARMVIRIFCKKIDRYDRERFDSFSAHLFKTNGIKYRFALVILGKLKDCSIIG